MELVEHGSSMDGIERAGGDGSSTEGAGDVSPVSSNSCEGAGIGVASGTAGPVLAGPLFGP